MDIITLSQKIARILAKRGITLPEWEFDDLWHEVYILVEELRRSGVVDSAKGNFAQLAYTHARNRILNKRRDTAKRTSLYECVPNETLDRVAADSDPEHTLDIVELLKSAPAPLREDLLRLAEGAPVPRHRREAITKD